MVKNGDALRYRLSDKGLCRYFPGDVSGCSAMSYGRQENVDASHYLTSSNVERHHFHFPETVKPLWRLNETVPLLDWPSPQLMLAVKFCGAAAALLEVKRATVPLKTKSWLAEALTAAVVKTSACTLTGALFEAVVPAGSVMVTAAVKVPVAV